MTSAASDIATFAPAASSSAVKRRSVFLAAALWSFGAAAVAALHWWSRASVPDDYDSLNFILGIGDRFDMAALQPQFPGYPLFILFGRLAMHAGLSAMAAATAVSAVASGVGAACLAACAQRLAGRRAAVATFLLAGVAWLPWLLGGSALSESLGAALVVAAFACLPLDGAAVGFAAALSLGARASYWPLAAVAVVASARAGRKLRTLAAFGVGLAAWLVPFVAWVGLPELWRLGKAHLTGHFQQWGGSVVTRPDLWPRLLAFAKGLFYLGVVPSIWAVVVLGALVVRTLFERRGERPTPWRPIVLALAPYALWAFVAQNVLEQPRHLLPLVMGLVLWLGCLLAERPAFAATAVVVVAAGNLQLGWMRHTEPPAVLQAAAWIEAHEPPATTWIVGLRSPRFFRWRIPQFQTREHGWLSDVIVHLSRMERFPDPVLLTSEVDLHSGRGDGVPLPRQWKVDEVATFCRNPHIDFREPCLTLRRLTWNP